MMENIKSNGNPFSAKGSIVYEGEVSENVLPNTPIFYVFIPREYSSMINVKQFRMVTLTSNKGKRYLDIASFSMFGDRTGAKTQTMEIKNLNDECYKIYTKEVIPIGNYGIFYNYGGSVPQKLYDFDITK